MEKETRQKLERLTQRARRLLEQELREQLEGRYDILLDGRIPLAPGAHLSPPERVLWDKLVAAVAHKRAQGMSSADAVASYLREAAFHTLNRFVALKMLEARKLVQECISRGEDSAGFKEFIALAPGLVALPDKGYRLYVETIFDEIAQEVRALFDRRDAATLLWPRRQALLDLLAALNDPEVVSVWGDDETIGWVYQYFNGEDERRQMRAESQAPRNSRELAVRNQFFTPRYVVQFLTDNSLGRTWCEMRGADTQLAHLDYLVKPEEGFEERFPKDPRDLHILDPACGSGHFLLYAFDLLAGDPTRSFFGIYEEAWRAETAPKSEVTGRTLKEDYDTELALRRAVPELILKHNLYGVDIDPRAAQIAGLALWMRAQRAYNDHKVAAQDRPLIGRTNIVTAEPMPGDRSMVAEFASTLRPRVLGELFQRIVEEMRLAGELGSLLKIDRALQSAVAKAREQFINEKREPQKFLPGFERPRSPQLEFDLSGVSDEAFFDSAEEHIFQALQEYSARAPVSMSVRRQLFADDAAQGIAFIDLSRQRYDVVLMNPPFGSASEATEQRLRDEWGSLANELYALFLARGVEWLISSGGLLGAITSRGWLKGRDLREFRPQVLGKGRASLITFVDLGLSVLDGAEVETGLTILSSVGKPEVAQFADFTAYDRALLQHSLMSASENMIRRPISRFLRVPESSILFDATDDEIDALASDHCLDPDYGRVTRGLNSSNDERFMRLFWEVPESSVGARYKFCAKGGEYGWLVPNIITCIDWLLNGRYLEAAMAIISSNVAQARRSSRYYFREGATCTYRCNDFSLRVLPRGCIFTNSAPVIIPKDPGTLPSLFATFMSSRFEGLLRHVQKKGKYDTGRLGKLPPPSAHAAADASEAFATLMSFLGDWERQVEVSPYFGGIDLESALGECVAEERHASELFERLALSTGERPSTAFVSKAARAVATRYGRVSSTTAVVSYALGWCFGRYGRFVAGRTDPYRPLENEFNERCAAAPANAEGILGHIKRGRSHAVTSLLRAMEEIWGEDGRDLILEALGGPEQVSEYLSDPSGFWSDHLVMYSGAFRKAPIYWQIATASGSYSVWIYIHRATGDTLFRVLNDFVGPTLEHEKAKLHRLTQEAGASPAAAQRREIEQQEILVDELQALQAEVARVAPLWNPSLDDGVILNFAPLWRLVPQSRSWQGECKKAWDKLVDGDYDWAQLSMHLWPERVVPKCIDDRSLAIAHGLEDVFWHEDDSGTWRKSRVDDATVQKLIHERTSTTVKAALKDLLSAATPTASKGRKAKARSASPRSAAPKLTPAAARAAVPDTAVDEATLRAVKAAIGTVADGASKADVLAATGLSDGDWNKAIAVLLDRGEVSRSGQKRGTRYHHSHGKDTG